MAKRKFTDPFLKSLKGAGKQVEVYDDDTKGLAVRVTPKGKKSFVYRYRFGENVKRYTIGSYPALSLAAAREKARELSVLISNGTDPLEERKRKKRSANVFTIKQLIDEFKRDYLPQKKKSTQNTYTSRIKNIEAAFGSLGIEEVTRSEVKRFLKGIAKDHPVNANRVQAIFSKIYSYAIKEGYTEQHPLQGMDKVGGKEKTRNPNYSNEEIKLLWDTFTDQDEPLKSLLKVLLLTGQRLGETSRMKWGDIDQRNALWIIPESETKGKKTHVVPLSEMAIAQLETLHSSTGDKDFVFASTKKYNRPLVHFGYATERIRKATGLKNFKIHDLRHIVITGMISLGIDFVHVGKTVAHKGLAKEQVITTRYAHYEYLDEKRRALDIWDRHLKAIIKGDSNTKIFKIGS